MSDTPRTDTVTENSDWADLLVFAQTLERELDAANREIGHLRHQLAELDPTGTAIDVASQILRRSLGDLP
jgi:hypothetical protein